MGKRVRDLEKEKQAELAAIWGSEVDQGQRYPKRRRGANQRPLGLTGDDNNAPIDPDLLSDFGSDVDERDDERDGKKSEGKDAESRRKKKDRKQVSTVYRLHCFVEPGTSVNEVRTVFEDYEPKVQLRTAQKGSLLNKTQYAVLAFANKALALHAVKTLDGTNQRDLLGVTSLKLNMMLTRQQNKIVRRQTLKERKRSQAEMKMSEAKEDLEFIRKFVEQHTKKGKTTKKAAN